MGGGGGQGGVFDPDFPLDPPLSRAIAGLTISTQPIVNGNYQLTYL